MKKRYLALLLAFAMVFAFTACTGNDPGTEPETNPPAQTGEMMEGGEISVGLYNDLDASLDPHMSSSSAATREILFNIFEGLVKPDSDGNLVPAIAESYSVNGSADQYTFKLRQGVQFHNGKEVTADDVVWSLSRAAGLETGEPLVSDVANIAAVTKTDDTTIVIDLKNGSPCGLATCYYNDEENTAQTWRDGCYHTGDTAWRDEDGFYWYVGRIDDVIKSSGYRIGPFEIESVLMELPYVLECAVTGVPDEIRGQVVK
ncbi:MAG: AMP-binding protein, partial [Firmicutes bacterium]|nr:AMP-binding protein [Bacillota bacterium]